MSPFQTLVQSVEIEGIGLHSGASVKARLSPREECGLVFVRTDLTGFPQIPAASRYIGSTLHATRLEHEGCGNFHARTFAGGFVESGRDALPN